MKKLRIYLIFVFMVFLFPFSLVGCGEATFENTPWKSSTLSISDALTKVKNNREYMDSSLLNVIYNTNITYKFYRTSDELFQNKTINENILTTLNYSSSNNGKARVEKKRSENNTQTDYKNEFYDMKDGKKYSTQTKTVSEQTTTIYREENFITSNAFINLLNNVIYDIKEDEMIVVEEKTFDNVDYYKFTSNAKSSTTGLELINSNFTENIDLQNSPTLFQIYDKSTDYIISFTCEYGFNKSNYLVYSAINYTMQHANNNITGMFENALQVSVVTRLDSFGKDVEEVQIEDKGLYTACTFVSDMSQDKTYVAYRNSNEDIYEKTTVQREGDNFLIKVENYKVNQIDQSKPTKYYYIVKEQNTYNIYLINLEDYTYSLTNEYSPSFLYIDYSLSYNSQAVTSNENEYQFGLAENYYTVTVQDSAVYMIRTRYNDNLYIGEKGSYQEQDKIFDITLFDLV